MVGRVVLVEEVVCGVKAGNRGHAYCAYSGRDGGCLLQIYTSSSPMDRPLNIDYMPEDFEFCNRLHDDIVAIRSAN